MNEIHHQIHLTHDGEIKKNALDSQIVKAKVTP